MAMKRTQVFLPDKIVDKLKIISEENGISKGEIIRQALFQYLKKLEVQTPPAGGKIVAGSATPPGQQK